MKLQTIKYHPDYEGDKITKLVKSENVPYLTFTPYVQYPFLVHGFSTRLGGVSEGEFATMNLSYSRGDKKENVDENYRRMAKALSVDTKQLVFSDQVHDTKIAYADGSIKKYEKTDGLITDKKGIVLVTSYADCVPLFFVDVKKEVIGLSHSGWRGTVGKIGQKTVLKMKETFGSKEEDIVAVIGPSICGNCYEVSEDVILAFAKEYEKLPIEKIFRKKENNKYMLNLWEANRLLLLQSGLSEKNVHVSGICTACNSELLFSHRKTNGKRGNLNGFLGLC